MHEDEAEEVGVVASTNTVVEPLAVVIESVNAFVANEAMATAW